MISTPDKTCNFTLEQRPSLPDKDLPISSCQTDFLCERSQHNVSYQNRSRSDPHLMHAIFNEHAVN